ncbi:MAG: DeoR family transcriptional regulator [Deltaproteobacteria bacterium]|nr:DeoR family transcriptional regulator [Deltaproteobacteria bacterium]
MSSEFSPNPAEAETASSPKRVNGLSKVGPAQDRQERIEKVIQARGFVTIELLAQEFAVTPQTIRRDINILADKGSIQRYHGGAGLHSSTENVAYNDRKVLCFEEKSSIARMVASHIPNSTSLFINIGTTTEAVARELIDHKRLRAITNNLYVASILSGNDNFEVIIASGLVRPRDGGIIGPLTIDFIQQFRVDYGIIGISGIELDGTLLDFDYREVRAARAIIENSRKVFLVADHTKIGRNAMVRLGGVHEIDVLFTDRQPPAQLVETLNAADVELHVAAAEPAGLAARQ